MQWLVSKIFNSDTHLPSSVYEWQIPFDALPKPLFSFFLLLPLLLQLTSYFAASASILNFSTILSLIKCILIRAVVILIIAGCVTHLYVQITIVLLLLVIPRYERSVD